MFWELDYLLGVSLDLDFSGEMGEFSEESQQRVTIDRRFDLDAGTFRYWQFEYEDVFRVSYTGLVRDGPSVDFYLTTSEEFNLYRDEERFQVLESASKYDGVEARIDTEVNPGDYVFFIDNTSAGEATDPGDCTIELEFTAEV